MINELRGKLFFISVLIDFMLLLLVGLYLENRLHAGMERNITLQLHRNAEMSIHVLQRVLKDIRSPEVDEWADMMGRSMGERITIMDQAGVVRGDSALALEEIGKLDNHLTRKEVQEALNSPEGISKRYFTTMGEPLYDLARSFNVGDAKGVVRLSIRMGEMQDEVLAMRYILVTAGILALLPGVIITAIFANLLTRRLRRLVKQVRNRTENLIPDTRFPTSFDDIGGLAWSHKHIADNLEKLIGELSDDRHRMGAVLQSMTEGVIALDTERRIILINDSAIRLLGVSNPAPIGKPVQAILPQECMEHIFQDPIHEHECPIEVEVITKGENCLQVCGTFLKMSGGCVLVIRDVTEHHRIEKNQQEFVANVSHELRTPVHAILIHAELLSEIIASTHADETALTMATHLEQNAIRLSRIIDDVLYLSRLDADKESPTLEPILLKTAITPILDMLGDTIMEKELQVEVRIGSDLQVMADTDMLGKVLLNLVDNVTKHCPPQTRLVIDARSVGPRLRVELLDNGAGIAPEHRKHLFERFYRVDRGRSRKNGGTGLGLSIVKQLVEQMGGEVGVEPLLPQGNLFWFTLHTPSGLSSQNTPTHMTH